MIVPKYQRIDLRNAFSALPSLGMWQDMDMPIDDDQAARFADMERQCAAFCDARTTFTSEDAARERIGEGLWPWVVASLLTDWTEAHQRRVLRRPGGDGHRLSPRWVHRLWERWQSSAQSGAVPIGRTAILEDLEHDRGAFAEWKWFSVAAKHLRLTRLALHRSDAAVRLVFDHETRVPREDLEAFVDVAALFDGDERAALAMTAEFGSTYVEAFVLVDRVTQRDDDGETDFLKLTGEVRFWIGGDPDADGLPAFMDAVRGWAKTLAGVVVERRKPGPTKRTNILDWHEAARLFAEMREKPEWDPDVRIKIPHRDFLAYVRYRTGRSMDPKTFYIQRKEWKEVGLPWPPPEEVVESFEVYDPLE